MFVCCQYKLTASYSCYKAKAFQFTEQIYLLLSSKYELQTLGVVDFRLVCCFKLDYGLFCAYC